MSTVLERVRATGAELVLVGDRLRIRAPGPLLEAEVAFIKEHRAEVVAELQRENYPRPPTPAEAKREERRQRVLGMLAGAPESVRRAWDVDAESDPHYVIVVMAIRDMGSCELSILRERYDAFGLLELIATSAGEADAVADGAARRSGGS